MNELWLYSQRAYFVSYLYIYITLWWQEEAVKWYSKSLEIKQDDADVLNNRGAVYHIQGQYTNALYDYSKALLIRPNFIETLLNRSKLYISQNDVWAATRDLEIASDLQKVR